VLNRRNFLAQLFCASLLPGLALRSRFSLAAGPVVPSVGVVLMPMAGKLVLFDSGTGAVTEIPVPNQEPHSVLVHPLRPREALVLDQAARTATLVDLKDRIILAGASPTAQFSFSGHGCYSADGKILYLAEFPNDLTAQGLITLRDPQSLRILRSFRTGARWSHNVALLRNGTVLAVGHRGSVKEENRPNSGGLFTFLSAKDGKLLEKVTPADSHYFLNHFDVTEDETIVISTQSYYGPKDKIIDLPTPLMIGKMGQHKPWSYPMPAELKAKMLHNHTLVVDKKRNRALVAHQNGALVSIWDLATQAPVKLIDLEEPQGIALSTDGSRYVIGSRSNLTLIVNSASLEIEAKLPGTHFGVSGIGPQHIAVIPAVV
jgi:hypothetical protein